MTCAKVFIRCTLISPSGERFVGTNDCLNPQQTCPRHLMDETYVKCKSICQQEGHAEEVAVKRAGKKAKGAIAYIEHRHICEECQHVMHEAGVWGFYLGPP